MKKIILFIAGFFIGAFTVLVGIFFYYSSPSTPDALKENGMQNLVQVSLQAVVPEILLSQAQSAKDVSVELIYRPLGLRPLVYKTYYKVKAKTNLVKEKIEIIFSHNQESELDLLKKNNVLKYIVRLADTEVQGTRQILRIDYQLDNESNLQKFEDNSYKVKTNGQAYSYLVGPKNCPEKPTLSGKISAKDKSFLNDDRSFFVVNYDYWNGKTLIRPTEFIHLDYEELKKYPRAEVKKSGKEYLYSMIMNTELFDWKNPTQSSFLVVSCDQASDLKSCLEKIEEKNLDEKSKFVRELFPSDNTIYTCLDTKKDFFVE
ncbi:MAG: hypothetical protein M9962_05550 [Oligoflexia bacterium]|nr:hypothetical protein [Oligoflexia bacterium]